MLHPYADAALTKGTSYSDYENYVIPSNTDFERYELVAKLGRGRYSEVFEGLETRTNHPWAIKVLKPVRHGKAKREIKISFQLTGHPSIAQIREVLFDSGSKSHCMIIQLVPSKDHTKTCFMSLSQKQVQQTMRVLLEALDFAHSKGIMHRDIKPQNLLIGSDQSVKLADWGLAEYYMPGRAYSPRVASKYYKAPQLLLEYEYYDYSVDIWGAGLIFWEMITKSGPLYRGKCIADQVKKISELSGTKELIELVRELKVPVDDLVKEQFTQERKSKGLRELAYIRAPQGTNIPQEAFDFLEKLLSINYKKRIQAKEALKHRYFRAELE